MSLRNRTPRRELSLRKGEAGRSRKNGNPAEEDEKIDEAIGDPAEKPSVTCASPKASPEVKTIKGE